MTLIRTTILGKAISLAALAGLVVAVLCLWLRPVRVSTAMVRVRELKPMVQDVGTEETKVVVQLAAKITGRIAGLNVDQGDVVRTSQLLVRLENSELTAEVERAAASLERVKLSVLTQEAARLRAQAGLAAADATIAKARSNQPATLLGGEQPRVAVAGAVINDPAVILADEPTAALDAERGKAVMELLRNLGRTRHATVMVVTLDERMIEGFDRVYHMIDGRIANH